MSPMTCAEPEHVYLSMYGKERTMKRQLIREMVGGESYEYVPLGKFVVSAPAVCRGRPTFKYTRDVPDLLRRLCALEPFHTRGRRLGKMARVSLRHVQSYTLDARVVHFLAWPGTPR